MVCTDPFVEGGRLRSSRQGQAGLPILSIPHPNEGLTAEWAQAALDNLGQRVLDALTAQSADEALGADRPAPDRQLRELHEVADEDAFNQLALERGWSDGLPLVAPRPDRVAALYEGWPAGAETVVAQMAPGGRLATLEKLAINAVMAGCRPEDFPIVVAAVKALTHPAFRLDQVLVTTSPAAPLIVVNGPAGRRAGINAGANALGPGARANAVIGRAVRLIAQNVGGAVPGTIDMATLGQPAKYSFCLAENEGASPWEPLAATAGLPAGHGAVTVIASAGVCEVRDSDSQTADDLLWTLAHSMTSAGIVGPSGTAAIGGVATLILCPEHAQLLGGAGLSRGDVQQRLWAMARVDGRALSKAQQSSLQSVRRLSGLPPAFDALPLTEHSHRILLVVAGGAGRKSAYVPGWGNSLAVACPIDPDDPTVGAPRVIGQA